MSNRNFIVAIVAMVVLLGGAVAYWQVFDRGPTKGPAVATVDLMTPSPLGELVLGKDDAPVTIIEYASTTCPHCANFHETTFPELKKQYIDTGKVRFIYREFPLNSIDFAAYMLTRCIAKEKFFPFLEVLFQQQRDWAVENWQPPLTGIAKRVGFTDESIQACWKNKDVQQGIAFTSELGNKLGVDSTPTFFINGQKYSGGMSMRELGSILTPLLQKNGGDAPAAK